MMVEELQRKAAGMMEKDVFTSFLLAAAVAGVSIGGTWILSGQTENREAAQVQAQLVERVDNLSKQVANLNNNLGTILVLTVRVDRAEKLIDRQEEALRSLREGLVPKDSR